MGKDSHVARVTDKPIGLADEAVPRLPGYRHATVNWQVRRATEDANIEVACDEDRAGR
ncbi:hypothetical protein PMI42_03639 [Bradyrhizobium sp. YR681]|nr:hypothetical protein PMI42_03639 [Bradyrhizobium sp. YR681]